MVMMISCAIYKSKFFFDHIQIDVQWLLPAGPERSAFCGPVDTFVPPPLLVQVDSVTIFDSSSELSSGEAQTMKIHGRSALHYCVTLSCIHQEIFGKIKNTSHPLHIYNTSTYYIGCRMPTV